MLLNVIVPGSNPVGEVFLAKSVDGLQMVACYFSLLLCVFLYLLLTLTGAYIAGIVLFAELYITKGYLRRHGKGDCDIAVSILVYGNDRDAFILMLLSVVYTSALKFMYSEFLMVCIVIIANVVRKCM